MNKLLFGMYDLMDAAGDAAGGGAAGGDGAAAGSVLDEASGDGASGKTAADGASGKAADAGKGAEVTKEETGSVLAEEEADNKKATDDAAKAKEAEGKDVKEPTAEEIEAYVGKIKKIEPGADGLAPAWDADAVKTVAPLLLKHKISDAAANDIIGAYAQHVAGQFKVAAESERQMLAAMRTECKTRFGNDLPRFATEGRRGGEHVFGKELFKRLASVEAFGSDPDIVEALAKIGRGLATDGAAGGGAGGASEKSLAERLYPTLKK